MRTLTTLMLLCALAMNHVFVLVHCWDSNDSTHSLRGTRKDQKNQQQQQQHRQERRLAPTPAAIAFEDIADLIDTSDTPSSSSGGKAELKILAGNQNVQTSNYGSNSFVMTNTGTKRIAAFFIDVTNSILQDAVFDDDGSGGDSTAKKLRYDSGGADAGAFAINLYTELWLPARETSSYDPDTPFDPNDLANVNNLFVDETSNSGKGSGGGYRGQLLCFADFDPDKSVGFSCDMDPNCIAGLTKSSVDSNSSPSWDVGGISGAEMAHGEVTVLFGDGSTITGTLAPDGSQAGAIAVIRDDLAGAPGITVDGIGPGGSGVYSSDPTITVTGPSGAKVRVSIMQGFDPVANTALVANGEIPLNALVEARLEAQYPEFPASNSKEWFHVTVTIPGSGSTDFSSGFSTDNEDLAFIAVVLDSNNDPTSYTTDPIYLKYSGGPPTPTPPGSDILDSPVTGFSFVDADDDSTWGAIVNGQTYVRDTLPSSLNIVAETTGGNIEKVRMQLTGATSLSQTEGVAPYALCGDNNGNYHICSLNLGVHTLTATPEIGGSDGTARTITFTLTDDDVGPTPTPSSQVTGFSFVDADDNNDWGAIANGQSYERGSLPSSLNIVAETTGSNIQKVRIQLTGATSLSGTEGVAPYALCGDNDGDYLTCSLNLGVHTLTATPEIGGSDGTSKTITFTLTDDDVGPTPTPPVEADPIPTPTPPVEADPPGGMPKIVGFSLVNGDVGVVNGVEVAYYDVPVGSKGLPSFGELEPYKTDAVPNINFANTDSSYLATSEKVTGVAALFKGTIQIPEPGTWTLYVASNDGSRLVVTKENDPTQYIADNDGTHLTKEESLQVTLNQGESFLNVEVQYFQGAGSHDLRVSWSGVPEDTNKDPYPYDVVPSSAWARTGGVEGQGVLVTLAEDETIYLDDPVFNGINTENLVLRAIPEEATQQHIGSVRFDLVGTGETWTDFAKPFDMFSSVSGHKLVADLQYEIDVTPISSTLTPYNPTKIRFAVASGRPHLAHSVPGGPYIAVDIDRTGSALVEVDGFFSHTHSIDQEIISYTWFLDGVQVASGGPNEWTATIEADVGEHELKLEVADSGGSKADDFTYVSVYRSTFPSINSMQPSDGDILGGAVVTIIGSAFQSSNGQPVRVLIGGEPVEEGNVQVVSSTEITVVVPPNPPGDFSFSVETSEGQSDAITFKYLDTTKPAIAFNDGTFNGEVSRPTALAFGPDERLYVGARSGNLYRITLNDAFNNIVRTESMNINEGDINRDIMGIAFNPNESDTNNPTIYLAHNHLFHAGESMGRTGKIGLLKWGGTVNNIITGLPVSDHDHGINGIDFGDHGELYITSGGNTNAGIPGKLTEKIIPPIDEEFFSACILVADVWKTNFAGNIDYAGTTYPSPISGSLNNLDLRIFAAGLRNPYDVVFHSNGKLYGTDNGPNNGFGYESVGCDQMTESHPSSPDELNLYVDGGYYGHPNRFRAEVLGESRQCKYYSAYDNSNNDHTAPLAVVHSSTNGITEFKTNHFQGRLRGHLFAGRLNGHLYDFLLDAKGEQVLSTATENGKGGLGVTQAPNGALFMVQYSKNRIQYRIPSEPPAASANVVRVLSTFPWRGPEGTNGRVLTVYGENMQRSGVSTTVTVGGDPCSNVQVINPSKLQCTLPQGKAGIKATVVVTVGDNSGAMIDGYRYIKGTGGIGR